VLGVTGFGLGLLLLFVVAVQALLLAAVTAELHRARADQHRAEAVATQQREDLGSLTKRVQSLEARTAGTLNSTAVARQVLPSVFSVRAGKATGTAFAFGQDASGGTLLVTNYHVVSDAITAGATSVTIERSKRTYPVTIDRTDKNRDLVVLHADAKFKPLVAAAHETQAGDPVIVVGAPLGLDNTVTTGVVSAVRDDVPGAHTPVIQFDAAINPGNSGGPVIDADGHVVGIAQAKIVAEGADGLGLAIPISQVCNGLVSC
jgi:S1-C subfamily serine protease